MADPSLVLQFIRSKGLVSEEQLQAARHGNENTNDEALYEELIRRGFIDRRTVVEQLAIEFSLPFIDLAAIEQPFAASELLDESLSRRFNAYPIERNQDTLRVAIADPMEVESIDTMSHLLGISVEPMLADERQVRAAIENGYRQSAIEAEEENTSIHLDRTTSRVEIAEEMFDEDDAPIIRLVQVIIADGVRMRASDIHLEPLENRFRIRYRVDGVLQESTNPPPKRLHLPVISRVKVMGKMSIAEKRLPQDGRIQAKVDDTRYDIRVSSLPTAYGESIVMRILDKSGLMMGLPELGFFSDDHEIFERLITLPDGILLVTGPTGSGKTTTLYSCLNYVNESDRKIITVEDPIEYQMQGINQVPVRSKVGMTFAAALKAMLRQAPNIIMVGEIRDRETAEIAINASLTGHMVFSTLHTNDAPSAVTRLVDIGIKPYLVATSLRAAMSQRLVRKVCPDCGKGYSPTRREVQALGLDISTMSNLEFVKGAGCESCYNQGLKGRFGLFEIFEVNEEIERLIYSGGTTAQLRSVAKELGMRSMRDDGVRKVVAGQTTVEEVLSATVADPAARFS